MANIGYARVSTAEQNIDMQTRALEAAGCVRVFSEHISSRKEARPQLEAALDYCRPDDVLVVWRLDRLGRSIRELIDIVNLLAERGIGFMSLTESLDTTTPGGRLVFHVFAAQAEFERDLIRERTMAGLAAARARGRKGGRPRKLNAKQIALAGRLMKGRETPVGEIAETLGVNRATLYRYLTPEGEPRQRAAS
jgi:DNA invertase Pin-like site-specific DNA recombinase